MGDSHFLLINRHSLPTGHQLVLYLLAVSGAGSQRHSILPDAIAVRSSLTAGSVGRRCSCCVWSLLGPSVPEAYTAGAGYVAQDTLCREQDHCFLQAVLLVLEFGEMHA